MCRAVLLYPPMETKMKTKKRGTKVGTSSFTKVKLSELNEYFGAHASVVVSRKFLENCGLTIKPEEESIIHGQEDLEIKASEVPYPKKITYSLTSFSS